jgi:hypothetical protein
MRMRETACSRGLESCRRLGDVDDNENNDGEEAGVEGSTPSSRGLFLTLRVPLLLLMVLILLVVLLLLLLGALK